MVKGTMELLEARMSVAQLIEVLEGIEDKDNTFMAFSYDSRVCACLANVVDYNEHDWDTPVVILRSEDEVERESRDEDYKTRLKRLFVQDKQYPLSTYLSQYLDMWSPMWDKIRYSPFNKGLDLTRQHLRFIEDIGWEMVEEIKERI